ncbi:MAG: general secretion pathway protein GspK [Planctomycetaceae bacterium]
MVLIVVLVVLALLALGAYTFAELMRIEAQATSAFGREVQARALADSGVELAASLMVYRDATASDEFWSRPEFQGVLVQEGPTARARGRFSLVAAVENDATGRLVRYGMIDESSKININTLLTLVKATDGTTANQAQQKVLMYLPGMTADIADAILDWVDSDSTPRESGAENESYSSYEPRNGPLDSLDELLFVRGVTPALLFGEDANRNGLLDSNENDGDASPPLDNADGLLDRGWSAYLTVYSRETNLRPDGQKKINVNMNVLSDLYDQIVPLFDEETAKFIIAYRISGKAEAEGSSGGSRTSPTGRGGNTITSSDGTDGGGVKRITSSDGTDGGSVRKITATGTTTGTGARITSSTGGNSGNVITSQGTGAGGAMQGAASALGAAASMAPEGAVTRGGIDVSQGGSNQVASLYDLIGVETTATIGRDKTTLKSPWENSPSAMQADLPKIMTYLTTTDKENIPGRININQARREVLEGIPSIPPSLIDMILGSQPSASGATASRSSNGRATSGWLVINGLTDIETLRKLDPYITARGDVFRLQSVGYFDGGGPAARLEAILDGSKAYPEILFLRDLTDLGRGFSTSLLSAGSGSNP